MIYVKSQKQNCQAVRRKSYSDRKDFECFAQQTDTRFHQGRDESQHRETAVKSDGDFNGDAEQERENELRPLLHGGGRRIYAGLP